MIKSSLKIILGIPLCAIFIYGCNGDVTNEQILEKKGSITRSASTQGGGNQVGNGVLSNYSDIFSPLNGEEKKLFAIYMIGSDLERKYGSGTSDFNEIVAGYQTLTEEQKANLNIVVAFGGANKDGWRGMRISNINQIINDAQDQSYGNESDNSYSYVAPEANMGHTSSLELFLKYIKNNYANHNTKFINLWDHGSGYGYFLGNDDYYAASESNTHHTYDLRKTFNDSGLNFDLVGYDTCLNGTMEVAKATKDYAKYLLSSEELEPGHGWNYYDVIREYAKDQDIETLGLSLVNSFIDSEIHKETDGKTLSIVNLSKYDALESTFNQLSDLLKEIKNDSDIKPVLLKALQEVRSYNASKTGTSSMDLQHFAELLSNKVDNNHPLYNIAIDLINKIKDYVIYSKDDGTRPHSNGVAVTRLDLHEYTNSYGSIESISSNWLESMENYSKLKADDTTPPTVENQQSDAPIDIDQEEVATREYCHQEYPTELSECLAYFSLTLETARNINQQSNGLFKGEQAAFVARANYAVNFKDASITTTSTNTINATVASFNDIDGNIVNVKTLYGNILDGTFLTTAVLDSTKRYSVNEKLEYYTPNWNQKWYTVNYNDDEQTAWLPMMFKDRKLDASSNKIITSYILEIDYIDSSRDYSSYDIDVQFDYAQVEVYLDSNNTLISHVIKPYTVDFINGKEVIKFGKTIGKFKINDQMRVYSKSFDMESKEVFWNAESDFLQLKNNFNLNVETLEFTDEDGVELDYYYLMVAEDINENRVYTTPVKASK